MAELRDLYQELILDHGRHPRNRRKMPNANREALGNNPLCGDRVMIYLHLGEHDGRMEDVSSEGQGCAICTASTSMMTEILKGKTAAEAQEIFEYFHALCTGEAEPEAPELSPDDFDRLQALSGVRDFPIRVKCATLAWHAMQAALCPGGLGLSRVSTEEKI
ncbi:MAG: SUF system NifU family Fe-S cluster assembly protein [Proteobacteria bacterium]|nr:SUF system NifU family Fe-S cluster assembly protein [Pseudomonadota bacterium]